MVRWLCGGDDFLKPINKYILRDKVSLLKTRHQQVYLIIFAPTRKTVTKRPRHVRREDGRADAQRRTTASYARLSRSMDARSSKLLTCNVYVRWRYLGELGLEGVSVDGGLARLALAARPLLHPRQLLQIPLLHLLREPPLCLRGAQGTVICCLEWKRGGGQKHTSRSSLWKRSRSMLAT